MGVRLTVKQRNELGGAPKEWVLEEETITLGRDPVCQVVLAEQAVSRNHARIQRDGTLCFVEDLGSAYGTQLNGQKLPKGEKRLLRDGDVLAIAQFDVQFERVTELAPSPEKTSFVARQVMKDVMKGLGNAPGHGPFFRIMNGPREGERIEISDAQELVIGRDARHADVVFDDDLVSRRHVKFRRDWSGTHVEDLNSRNGIKVNRKRANRKTLKDRDEVEVGNTRLLYLDPNEVREPAPDLDVDEPGGLTLPPEQPKVEPPAEPEPAAKEEGSPDEDGERPEPEPPAMFPEPLAAESAAASSPAQFQMVAIGVMGVFGLIALVLLLLVLVA